MAGGALLIGIDLEDVRSSLPDGNKYRERVPEMTRAYLAFFARHSLRTTFFTVGELARRYPELIREIVAAGHEIGCHTDRHIPIDQQTPDAFRSDLRRALDSLHAAGATEVRGFRAPILSLVERTKWAYPILAELGFTYSSSVLPRANPLYGWPEFGDARRKVDGVWELPVSMHPLGVPYAAGVYLRALPSPLITRAARRTLARGEPVVGYLHPYDADTAQERFMHPGIHGSRVYNWLMYFNRRSVFPKLERLVKLGAPSLPFAEFVATLEG